MQIDTSPILGMLLMLASGAAAIGCNSFAVPWVDGIFSPRRRGPVRIGLNLSDNTVCCNLMSGAGFGLIILDLFHVGGAILANRIGGKQFGVALLLDLALAFSFAVLALLVVSLHTLA